MLRDMYRNFTWILNHAMKFYVTLHRYDILCDFICALISYMISYVSWRLSWQVQMQNRAGSKAPQSSSNASLFESNAAAVVTYVSLSSLASKSSCSDLSVQWRHQGHSASTPSTPLLFFPRLRDLSVILHWLAQEHSSQTSVRLYTTPQAYAGESWCRQRQFPTSRPWYRRRRAPHQGLLHWHQRSRQCTG